MKELIAQILKKALKEKHIDLTNQEILNLLEIPPSFEMGDYSFPCFFLSKQLKQSPKQIALELRAKIGEPSLDFEDIQIAGAYINFFVDRKLLAINLIKKILKQKDKFGKLKQEKSIKTMVEFSSPNTNKPLHIGHLRNISIGESISRISEFAGEKIIRTSLNNDRGIHICKSMAAYLKYGKNSKPSEKIKSDHFVGKYYALFNKRAKTNEQLDILSHRLLQKWEQGDKDVIKLWEKMNKWAFDGQKKTYEKLGIKFDKEYYESKLYAKGKDIILKGLKDKIFEKRKDGAVIINLNKENLGEKILLRIDKTSVYITQDLYLAKLKFKEFKLDKSLYVTGNEQDYHFKVLFSILKRLGFKQEGLKHISYGMIKLPEGKIKSREGIKGLSADEILDKVQILVKKELNSRDKLSKRELEKRSLKIALSAIKYSLLKIDIKKNTIFNPKKSISFEGDTGPYIQYSYARASSILRKIKTKKKTFILKNFEPKEIELVKKLSQFPEIVLDAYKNLNPSLIANYSYQLAQIFNEFYHMCPVINSEQESFRISLVESFRYVLKNSLNLLGIETLEEM